MHTFVKVKHLIILSEFQYSMTTIWEEFLILKFSFWYLGTKLAAFLPGLELYKVLEMELDNFAHKFTNS